MTTRANIVRHTATLSEDFGLTYACRVFKKSEAELEAKVGRYVRGIRKGKLKGVLVWYKAISGGWLAHVGVILPNETAGHSVIDPYTRKTIFSPFGCTPQTAGEAFEIERAYRNVPFKKLESELGNESDDT